ncbi:MAG: 50S ribosomal protein L11 methyltransferase [Desulfobacteraceae bacterium]|nr:50S ribosomal protein L11 methyltransferase [Desulfobacteraceae bacterium]
MKTIPETLANRLKEAVMRHVRRSEQRCTPLDLERGISARFGVSGKTVRKIVKSLILENRLAYTQQMGRTFVETSINRPVHVDEDIIIAPPDISPVTHEGQILIRISPGASFGIGDHATTRSRPPAFFSLILANLRYPTLADLRENIHQVSEAGALLVFSGFRAQETGDLVQIYTEFGFRQIDELTENGWCGMVLKKNN